MFWLGYSSIDVVVVKSFFVVVCFLFIVVVSLLEYAVVVVELPQAPEDDHQKR